MHNEKSFWKRAWHRHLYAWRCAWALLFGGGDAPLCPRCAHEMQWSERFKIWTCPMGGRGMVR